MNEILKAALDYIKKGYSIMPLKTNSKDPLLAWSQFKRRIASEEEIKKWFNNEKNYNIGIVCGTISNNLEILDLDSPDLINFFKNIKTYQVKTQSNGYHLYFKSKKLSGNRQKVFGYPIDIRSEGGFGVAPPSKKDENSWEIAREDEILEINNLITFITDHLPNMPKLPKKEDIFKEKLNGKDIISKYIKVEKSGKDWKALCPFHDDHIPSFTIYGNRYFCYGCGARGDIVDFIQKYKKLKNRHAAIELLENLTGEKYEGKLKTDKLQNYATSLISKWHIITLIETGEILKYENGVYIKAKNDILKDFSDNFGINEINKEDGLIKYIKNMTYISQEKFDKDPYIINLKNGLYYINEEKLISHAHEHLSMFQIPVEYQENAQCPLTDKFISEITNKKGQKTLWEIFGYCLFPEKITQQIAILYGNGANGKSVYMNLLSELVGEKNTSRIPFDEINTDAFSVAELRNKLINISSEAIVARIGNMEQLKRITGENELEGRIKFVQERIKFKMKATCIFATNEIIALDDPKYAEMRRLLFVRFPNQFKETDKDPFLLEKLSTTEEQEGQLLKGINHLKNVLKNKTVYDPLSEIEKTDLLEKGSNQVNEFLENTFDWDLEDNTVQIWIEGNLFYRMLTTYCNKNGLISPSNYKFKRILRKEHQNKFDKYNATSSLDNIHKARKNIDEKKVQVWKLSPFKKPIDITEIKKSDDNTIWY